MHCVSEDGNLVRDSRKLLREGKKYRRLLSKFKIIGQPPLQAQALKRNVARPIWNEFCIVCRLAGCSEFSANLIDFNVHRQAIAPMTLWAATSSPK